MRPIYHFDQQPPRVTEAMLRQRLKVQRQTRLLLLAGCLIQLCILGFGLLAPVLMAVCAAYVAISVVGSGVLGWILLRNRRFEAL